jgi:hypothetical protein
MVVVLALVWFPKESQRDLLIGVNDGMFLSYAISLELMITAASFLNSVS